MDSKENKFVHNKAGVKRKLLDTAKARKLAYYGHTMRKQGSCLEKEIVQGTMPGAHRRGRPRTAWMDNINTWTGLSVEESIRMTEVRDKIEKVRPWCGQPSDQGRLKNRTEGRRKSRNFEHFKLPKRTELIKCHDAVLFARYNCEIIKTQSVLDLLKWKISVLPREHSISLQ